jgi:hypothetical protein
MARPGAQPELAGGYSVMAAVLNERYNWPDGRYVSRQQVEAWARRQTRNKAGERAPLPVRENPAALRTTPTKIYDAGHWVDWVAAGVPGPRRRGWVIPAPRERS